MPRTIALVVRGRCRPSPDRVPQGAPSDRHGGRVVAERAWTVAADQIAAYATGQEPPNLVST